MSFSKLNSLLGQPDELETENMVEDIDSAESFESDLSVPDFEKMSPDEILDNPDSGADLKKYAIKMIRERYLKPQSEG